MTTEQTDIDFVQRDQRDFAEEPGFTLVNGLACAASLTIATPIALISGLINLPRKLVSSPSSTGSIGGAKFEYPPIGPVLVEVKPLQEREFDIIVYGATGFTGGLSCEYLARQYGGKLKWAIAGRRMDALEQVKAKCLQLNTDMKPEDLTLIQVDSKSDQKLQEMCNRSRVVVTTVGPFVNYGTPLVRAAIATKSNLCDITGETEWHAGLIDQYDEEAKKAGSKIVSFCGHDSIPWELSTYLCAKKLKEENGEELASIELVDAVLSAPSGGTLASTLENLPPKVYKPKNLRFNPIHKSDSGEESPYKLRNASKLLPNFTSTKQWAGPFIMSMVNSKVVERSNALNGYGKNVSYKESRAADSFSTVIGRYFQLGAIGPILFLPSMLQSKFLPQPGEGPSTDTMTRGFLQVSAYAVGDKGSKVGTRLYYRSDAGYRDTARMLVETGLSIALSPDNCIRAGGILTPATCCPDTIFKRLLETGCEFCFLTKL
jgi:short subunit dehydrogenase-like uncharacterized protein